MNNITPTQKRLTIALLIVVVAVIALFMALPSFLLLKYLKPELDRKEPIPYENHVGLKIFFAFSMVRDLQNLVQRNENSKYYENVVFFFDLIYCILALQLLFRDEIDPQDPDRKIVVVVSKFTVDIVYYPAVVIISLCALLFLWTFTE
jgi:hypothetical protein